MRAAVKLIAAKIGFGETNEPSIRARTNERHNVLHPSFHKTSHGVHLTFCRVRGHCRTSGLPPYCAQGLGVQGTSSLAGRELCVRSTDKKEDKKECFGLEDQCF